jgi:hypothetical protein
LDDADTELKEKQIVSMPASEEGILLSYQNL